VEQIVASGNSFLTKPFPTRKMLEAIQDALEE
jgi:FixJ family two-component response regulator